MFLANARSAEADDCSTFYVGEAASVGSQYSHHGSIIALWYDRLKLRFALGPAYPINYSANVSDFELIFESLVSQNISDASHDSWPEEFVPTSHTTPKRRPTKLVMLISLLKSLGQVRLHLFPGIQKFQTDCCRAFLTGSTARVISIAFGSLYGA